MVELKTEAEIEAMAATGAVVAEALRAVVGHATPGRSTAELDEVAAEVLARHGAASPFLNYHPSWAPRAFPAMLCVSVNDAVMHGVPNGQVLADGDLVSVDFGATLRGWSGDAARSLVVGTPRTPDVALITATDEALAGEIAAVRPDTPSATSGTLSPQWRGARATACPHTTAATGSAAPCTRNRTSPDRRLHARSGRVDVAHGVGCARGTQRAHRGRHRRRCPRPHPLTRSLPLQPWPT